MQASYRAHLIRLPSAAGMLVATLFLAFSLTPSLLPRSVAFQGLVSGLSLTLGYAIGRLGTWIWSYLELPMPGPRTRGVAIVAVGAACLVVAASFLGQATEWQNSVRALMGMENVSGVRPFSVGFIALLVFLVLLFIGRQFSWTLGFLARRLDRVLPTRVAYLLGVVLATTLFWAVTDGVVIALLLRVADSSYHQLDALIEDDLERPADSLRTGSAASLVQWADLGKQGRSFVASGPTASDIGGFLGAPAREPIRVYVGLSAAGTPKERAELALRELLRVGGFDRSVLLLVTPTGTGWMDAASLDAVEYLHRGDIATVAAQYSYLPSPLALLSEGAYGAETARAVFEAIYGRWRTLPRDRRPALYLHGVSLGALNSDISFDFYDIVDDPFQGALWAGPPFRSPTWNGVTESRNPDSPAWLPRFRDGSVVRFMNQQGGLDAPAAWGRFRIAYLQYASDPVTFFSVRSFWREPAWLRTPRGPDVSPQLRWYPVVTALQLAADIAAGVHAAPPGFGHNFSARHYVDAWRALTEPAGWTDADAARLKDHIASTTAARRAPE